MSRIIFLSAAVMPKADLLYHAQKFRTDIFETAMKAREGEPMFSYVGHDATAQFMTKELGVEVVANRAPWEPQPGDFCVCCKTKQGVRLPELTLVPLEEMEQYFELSIISVYSSELIENLKARLTELSLLILRNEQSFDDDELALVQETQRFIFEMAEKGSFPTYSVFPF